MLANSPAVVTLDFDTILKLRQLFPGSFDYALFRPGVYKPSLLAERGLLPILKAAKEIGLMEMPPYDVFPGALLRGHFDVADWFLSVTRPRAALLDSLFRRLTATDYAGWNEALPSYLEDHFDLKAYKLEIDGRPNDVPPETELYDSFTNRSAKPPGVDPANVLARCSYCCRGREREKG